MGTKHIDSINWNDPNREHDHDPGTDFDHRTQLQKDLHKRLEKGETLTGRDAMDILNRSYPPEYTKQRPKHEDDIEGY